MIDQLYREGATEGDGGTADAIRKQLKTGELTGKKDHIQKGKERIRQIDKILKREPDHPDRDLFELLKNDLKRALGGN